MKHYTEDQIAKYLNTYVVPQDLKIRRMILSRQLDKNGEAMVYIRLRRYDPATGKDVKEKKIPTNIRVKPKNWSNKKGEVLKGEGVAKAKLWVAPPTKMDEAQLTEEGYYAAFAAAGARIEIPGCSLCMGNQAQVSEGSTVFSTSTRNFDNRLGKNSKVYLGSAEVAAVAALLGRLPSVQEYLDIVAKKINESNKDGVYKYLNFHQVTSDHLTTLLTSR